MTIHDVGPVLLQQPADMPYLRIYPNWRESLLHIYLLYNINFFFVFRRIEMMGAHEYLFAFVFQTRQQHFQIPVYTTCAFCYMNNLHISICFIGQHFYRMHYYLPNTEGIHLLIANTIGTSIVTNNIVTPIQIMVESLNVFTSISTNLDNKTSNIRFIGS